LDPDPFVSGSDAPVFISLITCCLQASLGDSCENKENDELMAEACRQAARQASATLRQKVLAANNGNLAIKGEEGEEEKAKINGNGTDHSSEAEQVS
jgi:hypothetical protein